MAKFMILYRESATAREQMAGSGREQAQALMEAWMTWAGKAGSALVDLGSPLGSAGSVGKATGKPAEGSVGGFSILEADSASTAKKLLDGHPHLDSPGDPSIEILEYLPIPGT